ncbi:MAG: homoserine dehydrogenase [Candidatus Omnitrophica bacterium]|nr:homoserine dehydrogenase [Candidatus Omnitrophota bacterium]
MRALRIGLLGLGQIGSAFYSLLHQKREYFEKEIGVRFDIVKVAVKHRSKKRHVSIASNILTDRAEDLIQDASLDVIVELIGGTRDARRLVSQALRAGKHVVTANKALLAEYGDEIFELANRKRRWLLFEASVGGGIPVIKALREGLVANRFDSIYSIINGTCNYILSEMTAKKTDFKDALNQAQAKGFAEADPRLDLDGVDAAHKLALLVRFAFGGKVKLKDIYCEGISRIRSEDIAFAEEFGYRVKLLAIAKKTKDGIEARVQPTLLPKDHILANVNGSFNAVLFRGDEVGDSLLYGRGAGGHPTASAIVSDLMDIALRQETRFDEDEIQMRAIRKPLRIKNISSILSRYYLRFHVVDRPGVLAGIARVLGAHRISISDVIQKERSVGNIVPLILLTHDAHERNVRNSLRQIDRSHGIQGKSQVLRIEGN